MPISSKKSWTPSPSPAKDEKEKGAKRKTAERPMEARPQDERQYLPIKGPGINIPIPLPFGYKVRFQTKFVILIVFGLLCYVYGSFVQNEWLYLLATGFVMVSAFGFIIPALQIFQLRAEIRLPENMQMADVAQVQVRIARRGPFATALGMLLPIRSVNLSVVLTRRGTKKRPPEKMLPPESYFIDSLEDEVILDLETPGLKRGVYILESIELSTWFPFGFIWWSHKIVPRSAAKGGKTFITVFPKMEAIAGSFLLQLPAFTSSMGLSSSISVLVPQSSIVRGVREFKYGDSPRHIHWPSSARQGKLLVREFDSETLPVFDVYFDLRADWKGDDQFELAVLTANSLLHMGHNMGIMPELVINPAFDDEAINDLMSDLPKLQPGLQLLSEILARVEPVGWQGVNDRTGNALFDHLAGDNRHRTIVSLVPSTETLMKHTALEGDKVVYPVVVSLVEGIIDAVEPLEAKAGAKVQFKAARQKDGAPERASGAKTVLSSPIATVTDSGDLAAL